MTMNIRFIIMSFLHTTPALSADEFKRCVELYEEGVLKDNPIAMQLMVVMMMEDPDKKHYRNCN